MAWLHEHVGQDAPLLVLEAMKMEHEVLAESGIDYCVVLPFTPTLARYTADQFIGVLKLPPAN